MITIAIRLRSDYDTTIPRRIRLYDGSDRNYDLRSIRLRYDYDEKLTCSFLADRTIGRAFVVKFRVM